MITELVYHQYKRLWRASPWKSLDDMKLKAIAEYELENKETIPAEERFLTDDEIDGILGMVDGKYQYDYTRCQMGPGVTGNTACRDGEPEKCYCGDLINEDAEHDGQGCDPCCEKGA